MRGHIVEYCTEYYTIHPDNDKSILKVLFYRVKNNNKARKYCSTLSRSRPYRKNDNAHVEQKNDDKVRKLVGYYRYDTTEEVDFLNRLYEKADILDNFFIPSSKLIEKIRDNNARVIRRVHDKPKTPFQRLNECDALTNPPNLSMKLPAASCRVSKYKLKVSAVIARNPERSRRGRSKFY